MIRLFGSSALALTILFGAACGTGEPLGALEFDETDDRLLDYPFAPEVSEIVEIDQIEASGRVNIRVASTEDHLVVRGPLNVLDVPDEGFMLIHLEAEKPRVTEEPAADEETAESPQETPTAVEGSEPAPEQLESDDMRFVLFSEDADGGWSPIVVLGEYEVDGIPTVSQLISFDMVVYSPEHRQMIGYHGSIGREFTGAMDVDTTGRIGVFALPEITAGDLVGTHRYTMQAMCGERACKDPVPRGAREDLVLHGDEPSTSESAER